jgi:hypothetical protein
MDMIMSPLALAEDTIAHTSATLSQAPATLWHKPPKSKGSRNEFQLAFIVYRPLCNNKVSVIDGTTL